MQALAHSGGHVVVAEDVELESSGTADRLQLAAARGVRATPGNARHAELRRLVRNVAFISNLMDAGPTPGARAMTGYCWA